MWETLREPIIKRFPSLPGLPKDSTTYLKQVEETYVTDAYHSLSIEGYRVRPELIERVQSSKWNPDFLRAVLGHFVFVYIHPYMDGNGRIGRFLMNVMLASGGYPWTTIRFENRDLYLAALEKASTEMDIRPLTDFIIQSLMFDEISAL